MNNLWKYIILAMGFVLAAIVVAAAYTQGHKPAMGTITVTGLGETEFTSDLIVIQGEIEAEKYDAAEAYRVLEHNRERVISFLKEKGVVIVECCRVGRNDLVHLDDLVDSISVTTFIVKRFYRV